MLHIHCNFGQNTSSSIKKAFFFYQVAPIGVMGGFRWFGQCLKENIFFSLMSSPRQTDSIETKVRKASFCHFSLVESLHTSLVCTSFGGFGGILYIAISPASIHVSVFSILLPILVNIIICSLYTSWKGLNRFLRKIKICTIDTRMLRR